MSEPVKLRAIDGPSAGEWFTIPPGFRFPLRVLVPIERPNIFAMQSPGDLPPMIPVDDVLYWPWQKARETVLTVTNRKAPRELLERWFPDLFQSDLT